MLLEERRLLRSGFRLGGRDRRLCLGAGEIRHSSDYGTGGRIVARRVRGTGVVVPASRMPLQ